MNRRGVTKFLDFWSLSSRGIKGVMDRIAFALKIIGIE